MKVLELFKGTGSISKYFEDTDTEVISLDILEKYKPTICCDIMDFDYKKYSVGYFDIIWASPECKVYSQLQYCWIGRKYESRKEIDNMRIEDSKYINRAIEIIDYLKPKYYFIENPLSSSIWEYIDNKDYISNYVIVDYCYFGFSYKKPTKILTNKKLDNKRCKCKNHKRPFQLTGDIDERYSMPQPLLKYLFN